MALAVSAVNHSLNKLKKYQGSNKKIKRKEKKQTGRVYPHCMSNE